jgi:hypothetical protein
MKDILFIEPERVIISIFYVYIILQCITNKPEMNFKVREKYLNSLNVVNSNPNMDRVTFSYSWDPSRARITCKGFPGERHVRRDRIFIFHQDQWKLSSCLVP